MGRDTEMTWEKAKLRWRKMHQGKVYTISPAQLGLPEPLWTKGGSYQAANAWWRHKYHELTGPTPLEASVADLQAIPEAKLQAAYDAAEAAKKIARARMYPPDKHQDVADKINGFQGKDDAQRLRYLERIREDFGGPAVAVDQRIETLTKDFLGVVKPKQKPKTFKECQEALAIVCSWYGTQAVTDVDEALVKDAHDRFARQDVGQNTRKKRFNIFKRFVNYLVEMHLIESPRNLHSRTLVFEIDNHEVPTWEPKVVKAAVLALPERFRLYALLGLNCGMTNVDIAELTKNQINGGFLTRRRVKTRKHKGVTEVTYWLWPETLGLLEKFKSSHQTLWLTSSDNTKLVESRVEGDDVKTKDLIYQEWRRAKLNCPIPLYKFRSVGANGLEQHKEYGRYWPHFLGHTPSSVGIKFYVRPSPQQFEAALRWLRGYLLVKS